MSTLHTEFSDYFLKSTQPPGWEIVNSLKLNFKSNFHGF